MTKLRTIVTYLEMSAPPARSSGFSPSVRTALMRAGDVPLHFYRYLQTAVGERWFWWMRRAMDDPTLAGIVHDPLVDIYILYADGAPAGLGELDRRTEGAVEVAYFGLIPERIGEGLGAFFMDRLLDAAWHPSDGVPPDRVWLHSCNLDHPGAIRFYQRAGFTPYRREEDIIDDPREIGIIPADIPLPAGVDTL